MRACTNIYYLLFVFTLSMKAEPLDYWTLRNPSTNGTALQASPHSFNSLTTQSGMLYAVGAAGVVIISNDGTNWTEYQTATTNNLNRIHAASNLLVAIGSEGVVEYSTNGFNWNLAGSGTTNNLTGITFGNGRWVVVGGSAIITSTNGVNWSMTGLTGLTGVTTLKSMAYGNAGFVGSAETTGFIYKSTDGLTWTSQNMGADLGPIAYGGGQYFLGSVSESIEKYYPFGNSYYVWKVDDTGYVSVSSDAVSWTAYSLGTDTAYYNFPSSSYYKPVILAGTNGTAWVTWAGNNWHFLAFNGSSWSAVAATPPSYLLSGVFNGTGTTNYLIANSSIYSVALSGTQWRQVNGAVQKTSGPKQNFNSIAFSNDICLLASPNPAVLFSKWTNRASSFDWPAFNSVLYNGTNFLGVGNGGKIFVSSNGVSWTQKNSGTTVSLRHLFIGGGLLVAIGESGAIQTSASGNVWSTRLSGSSLILNGGIYANGQYVVVGQLGTVLTSTDGVNWTGQDCGFVNDLYSVTHGGPAGYLAVGAGGKILTSIDGVSWTPQSAGTTKDLRSASYGNGYYLVAGDGGRLFTSPDGINWLPRILNSSNNLNYLGSTFNNNRFYVLGSGGVVWESDSFAPLFAMALQHTTIADKVTTFAPAGTSFRLQSSPSLIAPVWTDIATFPNAGQISFWTNPVSGSQKYYRCISP